MQRIEICCVGRPKDDDLEGLIKDYVKRLQRHVELILTWDKNDEMLIKRLEKSSRVLCLDPEGTHFTSDNFSSFLFEQLEAGGSRLSLAVGGAKGLPEILLKKHPTVSLSKMTLTHQMARLLLAEQIYRADQIRQGTPYHK